MLTRGIGQGCSPCPTPPCGKTRCPAPRKASLALPYPAEIDNFILSPPRTYLVLANSLYTFTTVGPRMSFEMMQPGSFWVWESMHIGGTETVSQKQQSICEGRRKNGSCWNRWLNMMQCCQRRFSGTILMCVATRQQTPRRRRMFWSANL